MPVGSVRSVSDLEDVVIARAGCWVPGSRGHGVLSENRCVNHEAVLIKGSSHAAFSGQSSTGFRIALESREQAARTREAQPLGVDRCVPGSSAAQRRCVPLVSAGAGAPDCVRPSTGEVIFLPKINESAK